MVQEYKIVWTDGASIAFDQIIADIANHNPSAAEKIANGILKRISVLRHTPFIGTAYPRDRSGRTRQTTYKKYRIFYRVDQQARLTVWHSSRQEPDLPFMENN